MNESTAEIHPRLQMLIPVAEGIAKTFGSNCEVVIHDLRMPESSLVYIAGTVTGRELGAPVTNIVLESIKKFGHQCEDIIGYKNITKEGRILKSTTIFARDDGGKIIGCLCINYDVTELLIYKGHLEQFISFGDNSESDHASGEIFASDVTEVLETMIDQAIVKMRKPIPAMQKEDKIRVVLELDDKGAFLIKGAVDKVAAMLGVSRYTIYNYLEEGRSNRKHQIL